MRLATRDHVVLIAIRGPGSFDDSSSTSTKLRLTAWPRTSSPRFPRTATGLPTRTGCSASRTIRSSRSSKATAPAPTSGARRVRVFDAAVEKAYGGERKVAWMEVFAGEKAFTAVRRLAAGRDARRDQRVPRLDQGPAHDAGRRRHPLAERHAAPGARPVRLHPPGALLRGRRQPDEGAGEAQRRDLPREHRGRLRRHRVEGRLAGGGRSCASSSRRELGKDIREHSAIGIKPMSAFGSQAPRRDGDPLRDRSTACRR